MAETITRIVRVNRIRSPQEALNATGRNQYVNPDVINAMPKGEGEKTKVVFFSLGHWVSDEDLEREYEARGLKPVDPYSLAAVNEADPAFADSHPNSTHWKDSNGQWCYTVFCHWIAGGRRVNVNRIGVGWRGGWWFGGLRK
ncbi:MAG: hypothetical protein A3B92_00400 [Candidatus Harrisonbacteria bacterium RIFCSPHIGHO2_02_FULL_42_16]|uniref:Uncharacterized protein n=1 Tax=Candidatus Harrisonbacteria bacterium RIFCSPHIGHO2_02_FULL_42_16 TaxID=1798404 RepID=A0A1G1ZJ72_9BACT|nr:MAG: hypothetical protein A3B92_00400 [Candidatus Harrisonbacteria bacterium RIFCSPHIGHO2_02_FULL_42_16]